MKRSFIWATVIGLCIVVSAAIIGNAYKFKYKSQDVITVTGLGELEFVSDLIVWQGYFSQESLNLQDAYKQLENNRNIIKEYLKSKGISDSAMVFSFVNIYKQNDPVYANGNYIGTRFSGYQLSQTVKIESTDIEKIELLSRQISELITKGIQLESYAPQYYYTKLSDLKMELISKATEDASMRAEKVASQAGAKLGKLMNARMGVIQITGTNSNEAFTAGGTYNTESKNKKARITMKLDYHIK